MQDELLVADFFRRAVDILTAILSVAVGWLLKEVNKAGNRLTALETYAVGPEKIRQIFKEGEERLHDEQERIREDMTLLRSEIIKGQGDLSRQIEDIRKAIARSRESDKRG